MINSFLNSFVF